MIRYLEKMDVKKTEKKAFAIEYDFLKINNTIFSTLNTIIRFYGLNSTLLSIK